MSRPLRAIAALAITGLLLAGCSTPPNTAAVVNGQRITETEVGDAWLALEPAVADGVGPTIVVESLVQNALLAPVAADFGMSASAEDIASFADSVYEGAPPDPFPAGLTNVLGFILLADQVNSSPLSAEIQEAYLLAVQDAEIEVNPRFGTINEMAQLDAPAFEWMTSEQ